MVNQAERNVACKMTLAALCLATIGLMAFAVGAASPANNPVKVAPGRLMLRHRLIDVPGVGHDGDAMFTSPAGLAALFEQ